MSKYDALYYPVPRTTFEFAVNANLQHLRLAAMQGGYEAIAAQVKLDQVLAIPENIDREPVYRLAIESGTAPHGEAEFTEKVAVIDKFDDTLSGIFRLHDPRNGREKAYQALDSIAYPEPGDLPGISDSTIKILEVSVFTHYQIALNRFMGGGKAQDKGLFLYNPKEVDRRVIAAYVDRRVIAAYLDVERHYTIGAMDRLFKLCGDGYTLNKRLWAAKGLNDVPEQRRIAADVQRLEEQINALLKD